jgi:dTDP-4-dehydrorhamnose 3,5-epimerase
VSSPWQSTLIPGVYRTNRPVFSDDRGAFVKILGEGDEGAAPAFVPREVFWSQSAKGVFRGMHVQLPPRAARKLVFITHGAVRDFVLDLRRGSPTQGKVDEFHLSDETGGLVIPAGCAHGFEVLSEGASMVYLQEDFHSPEHDTGVLYSSIGLRLEALSPVISARDLALPSIAAFRSPFEFA